MSVRVVARVRPLLKAELEKDIIVSADSVGDGNPTIVRIPNPKNEAEDFSFQFNNVYEAHASQQELFDGEGKTIMNHKSTKAPINPISSCAYGKTPFQWLRCHNFRLWQYWNWKDSYHAGREVIGRSWCHSTAA